MVALASAMFHRPLFHTYHVQLLWQKFSCSLSLMETAQGPGSIQISKVLPPKQGDRMVLGIGGTCVAYIGFEGVLQWFSNLPGASVG